MIGKEIRAEELTWGRWATVGLQRVPVSHPAIVAGVGIITLIEQVVEYSLRDPTFSDLTLEVLLSLLAVPAMCVYTLIALRALKSGTITALQDLRTEVQVTDAEYGRHVRQMLRIDRTTEALLLVVSAIIVIGLLVLARAPTPTSAGQSYLPSAPLTALFILATYTLLGWLLLLLVYTSVRLGRELDRFAQRPLNVNVFDPTNLLPFGRLSLLHSMTLVGLIFVLVVPLGRPTELVDYLVIVLLSLGSLLSLILPLRGVRRQMSTAKNEMLERLNRQFHDVHAALENVGELETAEVEELLKRADALARLRTMVRSAPTWPFRTVYAGVRAGIAAMTPLIYFILNEVLRAFVLPALTR